MRPSAVRARLVLLLAFAFCAAGATQCTYRGKPVGGSAREQLTDGTVSGFGSVFVGGVEYTTSGATVTLDGATAAESDLQPGQTIAVRAGRLARGASTGTARELTVDTPLVGFVDAVDFATGTLTIYGRTVRIGADTTVGTGADAAAADTFAIGDRVAVWGHATAGGTLLATRVERAAATRGLRIAGLVSALDTAARRYTVGAAVVDYANAGSVDAALANGAYVAATGSTENADGSLRATAVRAVTPRAAAARDNGGTVEGAVTRFAGATDFDAGGRTITTDSATTYANGAVGDLAADVRLTATGSYDANGHLLATRIEFARAADVRVFAPIDAFASASRAFDLGSVRATTDARTRYEDRSSFALRTLRYANLNVGDWVEMRGVAETTTRNATALVVERRNAPLGLRSELQALAADVRASSLTLLGVPVDTTDAEFRDRTGAVITRTQFTRDAPDARVAARGTYSAGTLVAERVSLQP